MNPLTGQLLGVGSTVAIGALVPNSGNATNGIFVAGQGITKTAFKWPAVAVAPRFGMAYDVTGTQKWILRGAAGLFFDRPSGNSVFAQVLNPPNLSNVTVRYAQLQSLGTSGLTTQSPPALNVFEYDSDLPSAVQWNGGSQMALPWAMTLDVAYVGQHQYDILQNARHQSRRHRHGVPAAVPGSVAGGQHHAGRVRGGRRPDASLSRLQLDHPDRGLAVAHLSLAAALAAAPLPQRPVVRLQRHDRPLRSPERHAPAAARRRRDDLDPGGSGRGRQAARRQQPAGAHHQGQLRVGPARHAWRDGRRRR